MKWRNAASDGKKKEEEEEKTRMRVAKRDEPGRTRCAYSTCPFSSKPRLLPL